MNIGDKVPFISSDTFVAPTATVIGDVKIGGKSSIWYGAVVKGIDKLIQALFSHDS